jgi:hypothetical protein
VEVEDERHVCDNDKVYVINDARGDGAEEKPAQPRGIVQLYSKLFECICCIYIYILYIYYLYCIILENR